jgi:hypothetical protein
MALCSRRWLVLALTMALALAGCSKNKKKTDDDEDKPVSSRTRAQQVGIYLPSVGRVDPSNDLRGFGQIYTQYCLTNGRPPMKLEDMEDLMREAAQVQRMIQSGEYVVNWGLDPQGNANSVLAYQKDVPMKGGVVVLGDGSVHNMSLQEFQSANKGGRGK